MATTSYKCRLPGKHQPISLGCRWHFIQTEGREHEVLQFRSLASRNWWTGVRLTSLSRQHANQSSYNTYYAPRGMKNDHATQALSQVPNLYFHVALIYHFLLCVLNTLTNCLIVLDANSQETERGTDIMQSRGACEIRLEFFIFSPLHKKIWYKYFVLVNGPCIYYIIF